LEKRWRILGTIRLRVHYLNILAKDRGCTRIGARSTQSQAHEPLLARMRDAVFVSDDDETASLVAGRIEDLDAAIAAWAKLDSRVAEARLYPLAQFMGDVYAAALLTEQAAWERETRGTDRKALVARLYALRYLADRVPLRGIDADSDEALDRFDELVDGALWV
jgi:acyl-CoA dehydrogenase